MRSIKSCQILKKENMVSHLKEKDSHAIAISINESKSIAGDYFQPGIYL